MIVTLVRYSDDTKRTFGRLFIDEKFYCDVLEDTFQEIKVKENTRIPAGIYDLQLVYSPHFTPIYGHDMIHIMDISGFSNVLIHRGNTENDTAGCLIVGKGVFKKQSLLNSRFAYDLIYPVISKAIKDFNDARIVVLNYDRING